MNPSYSWSSQSLYAKAFIPKLLFQSFYLKAFISKLLFQSLMASG